MLQLFDKYHQRPKLISQGKKKKKKDKVGDRGDVLASKLQNSHKVFLKS